MTAAHEPAPVDSVDFRARFDAFYKSTVERTFRAAYRAAGGNPEIAHDATQEAYLTMFRILMDHRQIRDAGQYVIGIAVKKVVDAFRSSARCDGRIDDRDLPIEDIDLVQLIDVSLTQFVIDFLDQQAPQQRAVGVLFFLEEMTYQDISAALGMSPSTARTHVQRLRQKLAPLAKQILANAEGSENR